MDKLVKTDTLVWEMVLVNHDKLKRKLVDMISYNRVVTFEFKVNNQII